MTLKIFWGILIGGFPFLRFDTIPSSSPIGMHYLPLPVKGGPGLEEQLRAVPPPPNPRRPAEERLCQKKGLSGISPIVV